MTYDKAKMNEINLWKSVFFIKTVVLKKSAPVDTTSTVADTTFTVADVLFTVADVLFIVADAISTVADKYDF
jgi:hypothetical protein